MNIELLTLRERLDIYLESGESHYREFKSGLAGPPESKVARPVKDICKDVAETLVAFANADGGTLLVGVEDSAVVSGLSHTADRLEMILNAPRTHVHSKTPLPQFKSKVVDYDGKTIIFFAIPKGLEYVYLTSDGRCLQRKDLESVPIPSEEIIFSRNEAASREYDRQFLDSADMGDIDFDLISTITSQLSIKVTPEKFLQHTELAEFDGERLKLKRAALLLFAKTANKWHPRLQVRVIKVADAELKSGEDFNVIFDEEISDNLVRLIESSWELIRPHLTETRFSKQALFKTQIIYPELACREALINAIAHRDYSIEGRGIEVYVFSDRLEIQSPGELLSAVSLEDLRNLGGVHQSRNSNISKALKEIGYMRELGEGIRRIHELMKSNDLRPPIFHSSNKTFGVVLSQKHVFTKEEKLWLDNFEHLNLSREQKTVVRLGTNGKLFSVEEIWEAVGIVDTDKYRQLIESMKALGILRRTLNRNKAWQAARVGKTSKKELKQFEILIPGSFVPSVGKSSEAAAKPARFVKPARRMDPSDYSRVFVSNLPYEITRDELKDFFSRYGEVVSVSIPINFQTKRPRGFAFIEFEKNAEAKLAISDEARGELLGRSISVQKAEPPRSTNINRPRRV